MSPQEFERLEKEIKSSEGWLPDKKIRYGLQILSLLTIFGAAVYPAPRLIKKSFKNDLVRYNLVLPRVFANTQSERTPIIGWLDAVGDLPIFYIDHEKTDEKQLGSGFNQLDRHVLHGGGVFHATNAAGATTTLAPNIWLQVLEDDGVRSWNIILSELPDDVQSYDLTLFFMTGNDNNNNFNKVQFHLTTPGIYRFGQGTQNQGDNISKAYLAPHRTNFRQPDDDNANNDNNGNDKDESDNPAETLFNADVHEIFLNSGITQQMQTALTENGFVSADQQYWEHVFNDFIEVSRADGFFPATELLTPLEQEDIQESILERPDFVRLPLAGTKIRIENEDLPVENWADLSFSRPNFIPNHEISKARFISADSPVNIQAKSSLQVDGYRFAGWAKMAMTNDSLKLIGQDGNVHSLELGHPAGHPQNNQILRYGIPDDVLAHISNYIEQNLDLEAQAQFLWDESQFAPENDSYYFVAQWQPIPFAVSYDLHLADNIPDDLQINAQKDFERQMPADDFRTIEQASQSLATAPLLDGLVFESWTRKIEILDPAVFNQPSTPISMLSALTANDSNGFVQNSSLDNFVTISEAEFQKLLTADQEVKAGLGAVHSIATYLLAETSNPAPENPNPPDNQTPPNQPNQPDTPNQPNLTPPDLPENDIENRNPDYLLTDNPEGQDNLPATGSRFGSVLTRIGQASLVASLLLFFKRRK